MDSDDAKAESVTLEPTGFNEESPLHLIVMPPDGAKRIQQEAQLLAIYGSARVLAPFRLGGADEGAGGRWHEIIGFQRRIHAFAEGAIENLTLKEIRDGGAELFNVLFQGDVRRLYDQARYRHRNRKLNVVFTSMIPWVADLPWEFAYDRGCEAFLATSDVRFVRNVLTPVPADNIPEEHRPLTILVVSASPSGAQPLSADDEVKLIKRSFRTLIDTGRVIVDVIPRATPGQLHEKVRADSFDVIHFIGHGEFNDLEDTGYLLFEDDNRQPTRISTSTVKDILRGRGIRLMFLNACESARGGRADYNKGVAPGLVADGIPAVLANQYAVLDGAATLFSQFFYDCLTQGLSLGDAVREARIALKYLVGDPIGWAVPVLFARDPDARLCKRLVPGARGLHAPELIAGAAAPQTSVDRESADGSEAHNGERCRVAVWDINGSFAELDDMIAELNKSQNVYLFFLINLSVPYGTWRFEKDRFDGVAYLSAERVANRLHDVLNSVKADYVFCVTDRPLASKTTYNLYGWSDETSDYRINIFSTWPFDPPLRGESFVRALVNVIAGSLAEIQSDADVDDKTKGSVFYYNEELDRQHATGRLSIPPADRRKLVKVLSREQLNAVDAMLGAFHGKAAPQPLVPPTRRKRRVSSSLRSKRKAPKKRGGR